MCSNFISGTNLESCCQTLEKTFALAAEVSQLIGNSKCLETSAKRALSYNPMNKKIQKIAPDISSIASEISTIMEKQFDIVKKNPSNYINWIILGHCYIILGDFPNAFACYTYSAEINPKNDDPLFCYTFGIVNQHFGYNSLAFEYYNRISLNNSLYFNVDLKFRWAILLRDMNRMNDAINLFLSIGQITTTKSNLTAEDITFQLAYTYQLANDLPKANDLYTLLILKHPENVIVRQQHSWFVYHNYDLKTAFSTISLALESFPDDPTLNIFCGIIILAMGDNDKAYSFFQHSLPGSILNPGLWCSLGELYYKNEQLSDAQEAYVRALKLNPSIPEAWMNLGFIAELGNNQQDAIKYYRNGFETTNSSDLAKAMHSIISGQRGTKSLVKVNDDRIFTDVPKLFAEKYIQTSPNLQKDAIGSSHELNPIGYYPESIFA